MRYARTRTPSVFCKASFPCKPATLLPRCVEHARLGPAFGAPLRLRSSRTPAALSSALGQCLRCLVPTGTGHIQCGGQQCWRPKSPCVSAAWRGLIMCSCGTPLILHGSMQNCYGRSHRLLLGEAENFDPGLGRGWQCAVSRAADDRTAGTFLAVLAARCAALPESWVGHFASCIVHGLDNQRIEVIAGPSTSVWSPHSTATGRHTATAAVLLAQPFVPRT